MNRETLETALSQVSDSHLAEALSPKKKRSPLPWLGAVAAILAVAILAGTLWQPLSKSTNTPESTGSPISSPATPLIPGPSAPQGVHRTYTLAAPNYPILCAYPLESSLASYEQWRADQNALHDQPEGYADNLQRYFARSVPLLLSGSDGENKVCSPLNIYMALAMLAETTGGESRQQILDLLNAKSIESLRTQAGQVWKAHYNDDGLTTSILGSSLWVDEAFPCNEQTAELLAKHYYASVFSGDLGSEKMNDALRSWLSEQTGGLLDNYVADVKMDPRTVLALASTLYYQVQWLDKFHEEKNTEGIFHGTAGDSTETFMNDLLLYGPYYWSDSFGAVSLALEDGSRMWLFLPDEGLSPEQIMENGDIFSFLAQDPTGYGSAYANKKELKVNLSLPKFDIACQAELKEQLKSLGITDIFQMGRADFSPILTVDDGGFISEVKHAARVAVDEEGVTAAAFTLILRAGAGMPPEDEMDFILDRPFAFVIESQDRLPLFAGIVNQP